MNVLVAIITVTLLAIVIVIVSAPLRAVRQAAPDPASRRGELEAAREAKYREIRDMELDYRTGKLSQEDYEAIDHELRAEAIEILDRLQLSDAEDAGADAPEA